MNEKINEMMNKMIHKDNVERMIKEEVKRVNGELRMIQQKLAGQEGAE